MKLSVLVATLIAAVALAAPAEAATKKSKKAQHRTSAVHAKAPANANNVYVGGELVGRDPDPSIRAYMMRDPKPWEGND